MPVALAFAPVRVRALAEEHPAFVDRARRALPRPVVEAGHRRVATTEATWSRVRALEAPFIAIQGNVDRNIAPTSLPRLRDALTDVPGADFELHFLRGLNHTLVDALASPTPARLSPAAIDALRGFLGTTRWPLPEDDTAPHSDER